MATSNSVQHQASQQNFQQQQQNNNTYHCKDCGLYLNSAESLEVHVQYHKENLLTKWATQAGASSHSEETNNNNTKANIKREFITNSTVSAADSSDSMNKKSPEYGNRTTPEGMFGHPPTPQSYHSNSSPYQNNDNSVFQPNFQNFQQVKIEPTSPVYQPYQYPDSQFFQMDPNHQQQYSQDYGVHKPFRYHPYQQNHSPYDRSQQPQSQVTSTSPVFEPTPSPSPKQCDKCGYVCETAAQLIEHLNLAHPPTPAPHLANYQNYLFGSEHQQQIKSEEDAQSEILDLDSHKVHQVYPEEEKRQNGDANGPNPHSVTAMLNSWPQNQQQQPVQHQKMFPQDQHGKMFQPPEQQKIFQPHQMHGQEYLSNGVPTPTQEPVVGNSMNPMIQQQPPPQAYRPFEHLPAQPNPPVISSTQVPTNAAPISGPTSTKSANWKSNEARRPKTYNCTACNKWFTSSGHLKRHYNTTLHKNAVKSSGQPDPATLPISAHHHPARDSSSRDDSPGSPEAAPNIVHQTPPLHSPMGHAASPLSTPMVNPSNLTNVANGNSPNGEAGPSPTNLDSRGLLLSTTHNTMGNTPPVHGFSMGTHMMPMENQFQMYPNELAPHVSQTMVINSLSTTGEVQYTVTDFQQPLPSFSQFHRMGLIVGCSDANVGGGGSATTPYLPVYSDHYELTEVRSLNAQQEDDHYKFSVFQQTPGDTDDMMLEFQSPSHNNNNNNNNSNDDSFIASDGETQIQTVEDIKREIDFQSHSPPEPARIKRDYEDNVSASIVSSTAHIKTLGIHKCFECDKVFNKACYLTQHNKTFHTGDKPFKCSRCGKRFSSESVYREHHSKHAGDKPHKCELCPKQFNHKTDLRRHMCLHSGQKPYSCSTCGKGFIRKDHMLKHCETHLRKAAQKIHS